jgi:hypothetical protein
MVSDEGQGPAYWREARVCIITKKKKIHRCVGTYPSGPVVGKEYNPRIFWQHNLRCQSESEGKCKTAAMYGSQPPPQPPSENESSGTGHMS